MKWFGNIVASKTLPSLLSLSLSLSSSLFRMSSECRRSCLVISGASGYIRESINLNDISFLYQYLLVSMVTNFFKIFKTVHTSPSKACIISMGNAYFSVEFWVSTHCKKLRSKFLEKVAIQYKPNRFKDHSLNRVSPWTGLFTFIYGSIGRMVENP